MVVYQFDKPTETIFRYVCENPKANLIMLECLHNDYYNPKKSKANDNPKLYGDYAKSCTDYLVDCGLIFSKKEDIYTFFFPSAKGIAYAKFRRKNWILQYLPYFISSVSFVMSVITFILSVLAFIK